VYSATLGGIVAADASGFATLPASDADDRAISSGGLGAGEVGIAYLTDIERTPGSPSFGEVALDIVYSPNGTSWRRQPLPDEIGELHSFFDFYAVVGGAESIAVLAENDTGLELWLGTPTDGEDP
jgi:hypothetical protein